MEKNRTLDYLAKGFTAAHRIRQASQKSLRSDENRSVQPSNLHKMGEIMQILAEYSPDRHKDNLSAAIEKSMMYSNTYRNLKQHLREARGKKMDVPTVLKALEMLKPALGNNHNILIDKMVKIYEILRS
ncbi:MAG: hypothetical protein QHH06_09865 [Clostridiales bacterium]|jgi:hypothetical protein|nr:hypothetical protein [Eubacteriales bacterium]MDH7566770.1 hypothetical protein [Clostridiales bacterium]